MSLRFHEIAEADHRILNPLSDHKLMLLGEICGLGPGMRQLDLASGKGEMLCRWAQRFGSGGIGVDISHDFVDAARGRAHELGVSNRVEFVTADAGHYRGGQHEFDVVSCIGATWIGSGLQGTLRLMSPALRPGGLMLVGEVYLNEQPTDEAFEAWGVGRDDYTSLIGTLDRIEQAGYSLVEMVLSSPDDWDRYEATQWQTLDRWLRTHPRDTDAAAVRDWMRQNRRVYLEYTRRCFGWGVFVLRADS